MNFQILTIFCLLVAVTVTKSKPIETNSSEFEAIFESSESSDNFLKKLANICELLSISEEWELLSDQAKNGCIKLIGKDFSEKHAMDRERRFFSVGKGHLNKDTSFGTKGFKYGK